MQYARELTAVFALTALAVAGCADDEQTDPEPQDPEETSAEEPSAEETAAEELPAGEETEEPEDPEDESEDESPDHNDDAAEPISVETEGQGPYGLFTADSPGGESQQVSGKLIVGPGSCFSLTDNDQPELLVFGDDAEFVLRDGQPSVTTDELGTVTVGEQIELSVTEMSQGSVDGIPNQCAQGAAETVLIAD